MLFSIENWLPRKRWIRKPKAIRRRLRTAAGSVQPTMVELLEGRCVPSITSLFNAGALSVVSDGADTIDLGTNSAGNMTLNGATLLTSGGSTISANSVTSLNVTGGSSNNVIDLGGVTLIGFPALTQLNVDGGAGNDLIIGSQFADHISGQWGNDTIDGGLGFDTLSGGGGNDLVDGSPSSGPSVTVIGTDTVVGGAHGADLIFVGSGNNALGNGSEILLETLATENNPSSPKTTEPARSGTTGSSSANTAQSVNGTSSSGNAINPSHTSHEPAENDPKDTLEDHAANHIHWQKELTRSPPLSIASNGMLAASDAHSFLASLSSRDQSLQVLSRIEAKSQSLSANSDASTQKPNDATGLIDISDQPAKKSAKRPVAATKPNSPNSATDIALIAARVALPNSQTRSRPVQPARNVPAIFTKDADGGFIELTATAAGQTPQNRGELRRAGNLTRHNQVDAEIGRFVAFGEADHFDRTLAITLPKKVTAADTIGDPGSEAMSSTRQLSWGLALTTGLAAMFFRPRVDHRFVRLLKTRFHQATNVFWPMLRKLSLNRGTVSAHRTLTPRR